MAAVASGSTAGAGAHTFGLKLKANMVKSRIELPDQGGRSAFPGASHRPIPMSSKPKPGKRRPSKKLDQLEPMEAPPLARLPRYLAPSMAIAVGNSVRLRHGHCRRLTVTRRFHFAAVPI
jgi:hypothetical protein